MSLFRRRLLIQNALKQQGGGGDMGYIKDGLVFQLDGINKGTGSSAWTDLIQKIKFDCKNVIFNKDNLEFNGINSECTSIANIAFFHQFETIDYTFEFVVDRFRKDVREPLLMATSRVAGGANCKGLACVFWTDKSFTYTDISYYPKKYFGKIVCSRTAYKQKTFVINKDTSQVRTTTGGLIGDDDKVYIGCNQSRKFFQGKIYAIRIYNRELTQQEMLHNQQIDINRFFGGVTPQ